MYVQPNFNTDNIKPERNKWYWLAGGGPHQYTPGMFGTNAYRTFEGYVYWADEWMISKLLTEADLDRHTEELFRVCPIKPISDRSLEYLSTRVQKMTIGTLVDLIQKSVLGGCGEAQAKLYNVIIPEIYPLQRYGTMCKLERLVRELRDRKPAAEPPCMPFAPKSHLTPGHLAGLMGMKKTCEELEAMGYSVDKKGESNG
jgi:hypothetical protein